MWGQFDVYWYILEAGCFCPFMPIFIVVGGKCPVGSYTRIPGAEWTGGSFLLSPTPFLIFHTPLLPSPTPCFLSPSLALLLSPIPSLLSPIHSLLSSTSPLFANKTSHFVASWYRPPGSTSEEFQLFREQLDYIRTHHKGKKLPSVHVLGDFNFKDIDWPDRLSKSGSTLRQSEGQILIDLMNDHGLEQIVHFPTREKNTLDLILTTLPGQFKDVHSPDKLSDHDIVSGTLKIFTPPPPHNETLEKGVSISER